ncbi:cupin domain-containing protein [Alloalcanivorax gelatiniphagus]
MTDHANFPDSESTDINPIVEMLTKVEKPTLPASTDVMTVLVTLPPGSPGAPPHRHSGPAFGYVIEGEIRFELEGQPVRILKAGDTFSEPGGDVIHYQDGNNLPDAQSQFIAVMAAETGAPMLTLVSDEELEQRRHLRAPRP